MSDMFIKLNDVPGESQDSKHPNEIDLVSWQWGMSQGNNMGGTGAGLTGSKVSINTLNFIHMLDKASPVLMRMCSTGTHIKEANLVMRQAGGDQLEYLKIKLEEVLVSDLSLSAGGERPTESVTLAFAKVKVDYFPQKVDGKLDAAIPYGWDIQKSKATA